LKRSPVASGDSPDATGERFNQKGGLLSCRRFPIPVGESPTGTGRWPVPPLFKQSLSDEGWFERGGMNSTLRSETTFPEFNRSVSGSVFRVLGVLRGCNFREVPQIRSIAMNLKKWILAAAACLVLLAGAFFVIEPPPAPAIQWPNPNGYDDLIKAAAMIVGQKPDCNFDNEGCVEEWKAFLETNSEAIKLARVGLTRESRVRMDLFDYFSASTLLAWILQAEGQVAEKENRSDDAIRSYIDLIRLGQQLRGGAMISAIRGYAFESLGFVPLQEMTRQMTEEQRKQVVTNLTQLYVNRETFDEVMAMERSENRREKTLRERFSNLRYYFAGREAARKTNLRMTFARARMGLLLVDLAVKNYESEKGIFPKSLDELVPKFLPNLPKDDFSGNDFIYRPRTNGFQLYSVGYDGIDNGGTGLSDRTVEAKGDLLSPSSR